MVFMVMHNHDPADADRVMMTLQKTLYGEDLYDRWQALRSEVSPRSEREFVRWLLSVGEQEWESKKECGNTTTSGVKRGKDTKVAKLNTKSSSPPPPLPSEGDSSKPGGTDYKWLACPQCPTFPRTRNQLTSHYSLKHGGVGLYMCCYCEYASNTVTNMTRHNQLLHHTDTSAKSGALPSTSTKCPFCESEFTLPHELTMHIAFQHNHLFVEEFRYSILPSPSTTPTQPSKSSSSSLLSNRKRPHIEVDMTKDDATTTMTVAATTNQSSTLKTRSRRKRYEFNRTEDSGKEIEESGKVVKLVDNGEKGIVNDGKGMDGIEKRIVTEGNGSGNRMKRRGNGIEGSGKKSTLYQENGKGTVANTENGNGKRESGNSRKSKEVRVETEEVEDIKLEDNTDIGKENEEETEKKKKKKKKSKKLLAFVCNLCGDKFEDVGKLEEHFSSQHN